MRLDWVIERDMLWPVEASHSLSFVIFVIPQDEHFLVFEHDIKSGTITLFDPHSPPTVHDPHRKIDLMDQIYVAQFWTVARPTKKV
jgi:hypothetical protein